MVEQQKGINIKEVKSESDIKTQEDAVSAADEKLEEVTEEPVMEAEAREDLPSWMKAIGNDKYEVFTRRRKYIIEDIPYGQIIDAKARATGGRDSPKAMDNFEMALISASLHDPKLTELELRKLRSSEVMRLRAAVYKLYDVESFL